MDWTVSKNELIYESKELAWILLDSPDCEVLVIGNSHGWKKYGRIPRKAKMSLMPSGTEHSICSSGTPENGFDCTIL